MTEAEQKEEKQLEIASDVLMENSWVYQGCDTWIDPITGCQYGTMSAYNIQIQRKSI